MHASVEKLQTRNLGANHTERPDDTPSENAFSLLSNYPVDGQTHYSNVDRDCPNRGTI